MSEVIGKIKVIGEVVQVSDSFKKRELVVITDEQYPQHISIDFQQDKSSLLDNRLVGENVKVSINIGGREWVNPQGETKYFNSIKGWRIEKLDGENATPQAQPQQSNPSEPKPQPETQQPQSNKEEEHGDLPF